MTRYLADVNFIIAVLHPEHEHSQQANAWLAGLTTSSAVGICRVAQMGALRLLAEKLVMGDAVLSGGEAWLFLQRLFDDDRFVFATEPARFGTTWQTICESIPKGSSVETDAFLAAFAIAADLSVVTFDHGFARFPGVRVDTPR